MPQPELSVVVPARNVADVIGEQLEALAAQIGAPPFEVVIADNGSTDALAEVVSGFQGRLDVQIVDASAEPGAAYARNRGAREASGRVLLFCDADDLVNRIWVREMAAGVASRDRCLAAGALLHEGFNSPAVLAAYGIGADQIDPESSAGRYPVAASGFAGYLPTAPGGCFGVPRTDYLAVGGMDSSYPGGSEETDFTWRFLEAGGQIVRVPAATMQYRLRDSPRSVLRQQRIQQLARILLWVRFRDRGMNGPSAKASLQTCIVELPKLLLSRDPAARLLHARILGGHLGALQGILRYRVLRRVLRRVPGTRIGAGLDASATDTSNSTESS